MRLYFDFEFQNAWLYLTIGLLFILGSSLLVHMVFFADEFIWVPKHTKDSLFVSAVSTKISTLVYWLRDSFISLLQIFGYICALEAFLLAILSHCPSLRYRNIDEFSDLHDRELSPLSSNDVLGEQIKHSRSNHHHDYNKMSLAGTTSMTPTNEHDITPPACNQKAYIPGEPPLSVPSALVRY